VNSDYAVTEDTLVPSSILSTQPTQPGCANNWGIQSDDNNPPACSTSAGYQSTSATYQYSSATCPAGTGGQWSLLTYDTTVGVESATQSAEVVFQVATQPVVNGVPGALTPFVTVADVKGVNGTTNLGDPPVCEVGGPAATSPTTACTSASGACCPKSIPAALEVATTAMPNPGLGSVGLAASKNQNLTLKITINPSPDGTQIASVTNWQVSFDCVPNQ